MRHLLYILLTFAFNLASLAQLNLIQSPESEAFIPQNRTTQSAKIDLEGEVVQTGFQKINIKIYRNGGLIGNHSKNLIYSGGKAKFSQTIELKTGKYKYSIKYELTGATNYEYEERTC